ncbi:MAG: hypothetical protein HY927_00570 [Elusimicrobia bacterium]|nr:hypothetical protein [Elusimicrobiota bacterium]
MDQDPPKDPPRAEIVKAGRWDGERRRLWLRRGVAILMLLPIAGFVLDYGYRRWQDSGPPRGAAAKIDFKTPGAAPAAQAKLAALPAKPAGSLTPILGGPAAAPPPASAPTPALPAATAPAPPAAQAAPPPDTEEPPQERDFYRRQYKEFDVPGVADKTRPKLQPKPFTGPTAVKDSMPRAPGPKRVMYLTPDPGQSKPEAGRSKTAAPPDQDPGPADEEQRPREEEPPAGPPPAPPPAPAPPPVPKPAPALPRPKSGVTPAPPASDTGRPNDRQPAAETTGKPPDPSSPPRKPERDGRCASGWVKNSFTGLCYASKQSCVNGSNQRCTFGLWDHVVCGGKRYDKTCGP